MKKIKFFIIIIVFLYLSFSFWKDNETIYFFIKDAAYGECTLGFEDISLLDEEVFNTLNNAAISKHCECVVENIPFNKNILLLNRLTLGVLLPVEDYILVDSEEKINILNKCQFKTNSSE